MKSARAYFNNVTLANILYAMHKAKAANNKCIGDFKDDIELLLQQKVTPESDNTFTVYLHGKELANHLNDEFCGKLLVKSLTPVSDEGIKLYDANEDDGYYMVPSNQVMALPISTLQITQIIV